MSGSTIAVQWIRQTPTFNTTGSENSPTIAVDTLGNTYIAYFTSATTSGNVSAGGNDIAITKLDKNGTVLWTRQHTAMNTVNNEAEPFIAVDSYNNYIYVAYPVSGTIAGANPVGDYDIALVKIDSATGNNIIWTRQDSGINTTVQDYSVSIVCDHLGNVYGCSRTAGSTSGNTFQGGSYDIVFWKFNSDGILQWVKQTAGIVATSGYNDRGYINYDPRGFVYISYSGNGAISGGTAYGSNDVVIVKASAVDGSIIYAKQTSPPNTTGNDYYPMTAISQSGNLYCAFVTNGSTSGNTAVGGTDIAIFKMDSSGNLLWIKQSAPLNSTGNESSAAITSIAVDPSENVYFAASTTGTVSGGTVTNANGDIYIACLNSSGTLLWNYQAAPINTTGAETTPFITIDGTGTIYLAYSTTGTTSGNTLSGSLDLVVAKLRRSAVTPPADAAAAIVASPFGVAQYVEANSALTTAALYLQLRTAYKAIQSTLTIDARYAIKRQICSALNQKQDSVLFSLDASGGQTLLSTLSTTVSSLAILPVQVVLPPYISGASAYNLQSLDNTGASYIHFDVPENVPLSLVMGTSSVILTYNGTILTVNGITYSIGQTFTVGTVNYTIMGLDGVLLIPCSTISTTAVQWVRQTAAFNTTGSDYAPWSTVDAFGNVYVAYLTTATTSGGTARGSSDVAITKLDRGGTVQWTRQYSAMNSTALEAEPIVAVDAYGNLYVAYPITGTLSGQTSTGGIDIALAKLDPNGNILWLRQNQAINTTVEDYAAFITTDPLGNIYGCHRTAGATSGSTFQGGTYDIAFWKFDTNGNLLWLKQTAGITATGGYDDKGTIAYHPSGYIYLTYNTSGTISGGTASGAADNILVKASAVDGSVIFAKQMSPPNTSGEDYYPMIVASQAGNLYTAFLTTGSTSGNTSAGGVDIAVCKLDSNGNVLWIKQSAPLNSTGTENNAIASIALDPSENVYITGRTTGTLSGGTTTNTSGDIFISCLNSAGILLWNYQTTPINTTAAESTPQITVDGTGDIYLTYTTGGTTSGNTTSGGVDVVVAKIRRVLDTTPPNANAALSASTLAIAQYVDANSATSSAALYLQLRTAYRLAVQSGLGIPGRYAVKRQICAALSQKGAATLISLDASGCQTLFSTLNSYVSSLPVLPVQVVLPPHVSSASAYNLASVNKTGASYIYFEIPENVPLTLVDGANSAVLTYNGTVVTVNGTTYNFEKSFIIGTTMYTLVGLDGILLIPSSITSSTTVEWIRQLGAFNTSANDSSPTHVVDPAGNIYVAYNTAGITSGNTSKGLTDIAVTKLDKNGIVQWTKQIDAMNTTQDDYEPQIRIDAAGNLYIVYYTTGGTVSGATSRGGNSEIILAKLNSDGILLWVKQNTSLNTVGLDANPYIVVDPEGNIYGSSRTDSAVSGGVAQGGSSDCVFWKFDTNGNLLWVKQTAGIVATSAFDDRCTVSYDPSGYIYLTMNSGGPISGGTAYGSNDIIIVKARASDGSIVYAYQRSPPSTGGNNYYPVSVVAQSGNVYGVFVTSDAVSGNTLVGGTDMAVFKMDSAGNILWIKQSSPLNSAGNESALWASIAVDPSENVYFATITTGTVSGGTVTNANGDIYISCLNSAGTLLWNYQAAPVNTTAAESAPYMTVDGTGTIYLTYTTAGTISGGTLSGGTDIAIAKIRRQLPTAPILPSLAINANALAIMQYVEANPATSSAALYMQLRTAYKIAVQNGLDSAGRYAVKRQICAALSQKAGSTLLAVDVSGFISTLTATASGLADLPAQVIFPPFINGASVYDLSGINKTGSSYIHLEIPDNMPLKLTDGSNSAVLLYNGTSLTVGGAAYPLGSLFALGSTYYNIVSLDSVTLLPSGLSIPSQPTGVTAFASNAKAYIYWKEPLNKGGIEPLTYTVTSNPGGFTAVTTGTSAIITGLTNGTSYTFTVTAANSQGSASSVPSVAVKPLDVFLHYDSTVAASYSGTGTTWTGLENNTNLTLYGAGYSAGGITFAGTASSYARTPTIPAWPSTNNVTWIGWSKPANTSSYMIMSFNRNNTSIVNQFAMSTGEIYDTNTAGYCFRLFPTYTLVKDAVNQYAFTKNGTSGVLYINGAQNMTATATANAAYGTADFVIGLDYRGSLLSGPLYALNGAVYAVRVYSTTLSAADIAAEYAKGLTPSSPYQASAFVSGGIASISWYAPLFSGYGQTPTYTIYDASGTVLANVSGTSTTLSSGLLTIVYIGALNVVGGITYSSQLEPIVLKYPGPAAPTSITAVGGLNVTVSWSAPSFTNGSSITGYKIYDASNRTVVATTNAETTSTVISGLTSGNSYSFIVVATNINGDGTPSTASNIVLYQTSTVPSVPRTFTATGGVRQISLSWVAPNTDGGSAITSYRVVNSTLGTTVDVSANQTSLVVSGLSNATSYSFTVTAVNAVGSSTTAAASATTLDVPSVPRTFTAVGGVRQVALSWATPTTDGGSALQGYLITNTTTGATYSKSFGDTTHTITDLSNATTYSFTIVAINAVGQSSSTTASATTYSLPGQVGDASGIGGVRQVTLSWSVPATNGGSVITSYRVVNVTLGTTVDVSANQTSLVVSGLSNATSYTFTLAAVSAVGEGPSVQVISTPTASLPGTPGSLAASVAGGIASLTWQPVSGATGYILRDASGSFAPINLAAGSVAYDLSGLAFTSYYTVTLVAVNEAGESAVPASTTFFSSTVPSQVQALVATGGLRQITLQWQAPADNGWDTILSYHVVNKTTGWSTDVSGSQTSLVVSGLANATSYKFGVAAVNSVGGSQEVTVTESTLADVPGQVQGLAATGGLQQISLQWQAPASDGGSTIISYHVVNVTTGWSIDISGSQTSLVVSGLANATSYKFGVAAVNAIGTGQEVTVTETTLADIPGQVQGLVATGGLQQISLQWQAPASDGGSTIISYHVVNKTTGWSTDISGSQTSLVVSGLANATSYTFGVAAVNTVGTGQEVTVTETTLADVPGQVQGLVATGGLQQISLQWQTPVSDGGSPIISYHVENKTTGWSVDVSGSQTSLVVSGLANATTYKFTVAAVNSVGQGLASQSATATTLIDVPSAPLGFSGTGGLRQISLQWQSPASDGGSPITYYRIVNVTTGSTTDVSGNVQSLVVSGLLNAMSYKFTVAAANSAGLSLTSGPLTISTVADVPSNPQNFTVERGIRQISLQWLAPADDGGSPVTSYHVVNVTTGWSLDVSGSQTSLVVGDLSNGTAYTFTVAAVNSAGSSVLVTSQPVATYDVPGQPAGFVAAAGLGQISLSWQPPATSGDLARSGWQLSGAGSIWLLPADASGLLVADLSAGTTYVFQLAAINAAGTGQPAEAAAMVWDRPSAVTSLTGIQGTSITITWGPPDLSGGIPVSTYHVSNDTLGVAYDISGTDERRVIFTGLESGQSYTFSVYATNLVGAGPVSTITVLVPLPPDRPTDLYADESSTLTRLLWNPPVNDGGGPIIEYIVYQDGIPLIFTPNAYIDVSGFVPGILYTFTVAARNVVGISPRSNSIPIIIPVAPLAPRNLVGSAGVGQAVLNWLPPTFDGGAPILYYELTAAGIYRSIDPGIQTAALTGLVAGTTYTFTLLARNRIGASPSIQVTITTPMVPGEPASLTLSAISRGTIRLTWTPPAADGGSLVTSYQVDFADGSPIVTVGSSIRTYDVSGLVDGTEYAFKVSAINAVGRSLLAAQAAPLRTWSVPAAPATLVATAGVGVLNLAWTASADSGGSPVTKYQLTKTWDGSVIDISGNVTSYQVTGLAAGTTYSVTLAAVNVVGTGQAASASATTKAVPGAPGALAAVQLTPTSVQLTWSAPPGNDETITYKVIAGGTLLVENIAATAYIATGLAATTQYTFQVAATNAAGTGPAIQTTLTTWSPPSQPLDVSATAGIYEATVTWSSPASTGGSPITHYKVSGSGIAAGAAVTTEEISTIGTAVTIGNLIGGGIYTFTVSAVNAVDKGQTAAATAVIIPTVPDAPGNVRAEAAVNGAYIYWSAPAADGGRPVIRYTVSAAGIAPTAAYDESAFITNLLPGTEYTFQVTATNAAGSSLPGTAQPVTTPVAPGVPGGLAATVGLDRVQLSWSEPPTDGGSPVTAYIVQGTDGTAATFDRTARSTPILGLNSGQQYTFQVAAANAVGSGQPATITITTASLPGPITNLVGTAGYRSATLTWTPAPAPTEPASAQISYRVVILETGQVFTTSSTSITIPNLEPLQQYTFQVIATNPFGQSAAQQIQITPVGLPGPVRDLSGNTRLNAASFTWLPPLSDGGSPIIGYHIYGLAIDVQQPALTLDVSGLVNGITYEFNVAAYNIGGDGPITIIQLTTPFPPLQVQNLAAVAGISTVRITWDPPVPNSLEPIISYNVSSPFGVANYDVSGDVGALDISGLANSTTYTFAVIARNGAGAGEASFVSAQMPTTPGLVGDLAASSPSPGIIRVSWQPPAVDGSANLVGYRIASDEIQETLASTERIISNVVPGRIYTFTVYAINQVGPGQSTTVSITTPTAPTAPTAVQLTLLGNQTIRIAWSPPLTDGGFPITSYNVYDSSNVLIINTVDTVLDISGLALGQAYTYSVAAINAIGVGALSARESIYIAPASAVDTVTQVLAATTVEETATAIQTYIEAAVALPTATPVIQPEIIASTYLELKGVINNVLASVGQEAVAATQAILRETISTYVQAAGGVLEVPAAEQAVLANVLTVVDASGIPDKPMQVLVPPITDGAAAVNIDSLATDGSKTIYMDVPENTALNLSYSGATRELLFINSTIVDETVEPPLVYTTGDDIYVGDKRVYIFGIGSVAVDPRYPDPPRQVTAIAADGFARISWLAPAATGSSPLQYYQVIANTGQYVRTTGDIRTTIMTGLTNGTAYTFTVVAINRDGYTSDASSPTDSVVPVAETEVVGAGAAADPYVTTVAGERYKLPTMDGVIRFYQGMCGGELLTVNASLRTIGAAELAASSEASLEALAVWIPEEAREEFTRRLGAAEEPLCFFDRVWINWGDRSTTVSLWDGIVVDSIGSGLTIEDVSWSAGANSLLGRYGAFYSGYDGRVVKVECGSATESPAVVYLASYDCPLIRNGIYVEAPDMAAGNGVVVNTLGRETMSIARLDDCRAVSRENAVLTVRMETFVDHDGYRTRQVSCSV